MDFKQILEEYRVPFANGGEHRNVRYGWIGFDCPQCGPRTGKFHAGFRLDGGYVICWQCGHLQLTSTVMEITGQPFAVVKGLLEGLEKQRIHKAPKVCGRLKLPDGVGPLATAHHRYLRSRGFDKAIADLWGLQGIGIAVKHAWSLWIPVHHQGQVVSWTTRTIGDCGARYLTAKPEQQTMSPKDLLYGSDFASHAIVVVEGPTDAWAIGPGAVATFGLTVTEKQIQLMVKYPTRIVCFDNHPQARRRARRLSDVLSHYPGNTYVVQLETGDDPADADPSEVAEIRQFLA